MLNDFEQITLDRVLTQDELQRYIFRLVEDLNFRVRSVETEAENIDVSAILDSIPDAVNGKDGEDGVTYYTWIKYSPNADGSNMTNLPQADTKYIGISYNNLSPTESTDPTDYTWSLFKGQNGEDGNGIALVTITYGKSSSESTQPSSWGGSVPTLSKGDWLWVKTVTDYTDSTSKTTIQKSYVGTDGEDGTNGTNGQDGQDGSPAYVHIAWANSADGTVDFSTTVSYGKSYMGVYTDNTLADSNDPEDYNWSKIKGETGSQGQTGATGPQGISVISIDNQYVYSDSPTTLPSSPAWSTDVPTYDPTKYLWIRQVITYSNGSTTYTTAAHDAEMDDAISRLSDAENIIQQTTITIGDITVTVEGSARDIEDLTDRLTGTESAIDSISDGLTDLGTSVSGLTTTINGIEVSVDDLIARMAELREQNSELTAELTERTEQLNNIVTRFNNYVAEEGQYMRYGDQGLELGAEGSQFKTVIDNQRMAFMDGSTTTAYVSGQLFNMNNAVVKGTLKKGGYEEQVRTDGSVYTVWVGV